MASVSDALLPRGAEAERGPAPCLVTKGLIATLALSTGLLWVVVLLAAGAALGRMAPREHAAFAVSLRGNRSWAGIAAAAVTDLSPDCYAFTGGTCDLQDCLPFRSAVCEGTRCMCTAGHCTGADGICYSRTYPVVASGFTLTNKKYNWNRMYMPATDIMNQLKTTRFPSSWNEGKDKFILHELPGSLASYKDFFLTTEYFPNIVAAVRSTTATAFSAFGAYEVDLHREFAPDRLAVRVCSKGNGEVMIGSPGEVKTFWFYIHHASWCVYAWGITDPGSAGVWVTDPAIPDGALPECT